jgi:hypothetical protein
MKKLDGRSWASLRRLDCPGNAVHAYASRASCDCAGLWMATSGVWSPRLRSCRLCGHFRITVSKDSLTHAPGTDFLGAVDDSKDRVQVDELKGSHASALCTYCGITVRAKSVVGVVLIQIDPVDIRTAGGFGSPYSVLRRQRAIELHSAGTYDCLDNAH